MMSTAFLIGAHVVDNSQFAVIAAFTAAALLGIADFSGTRAQRLRVTAATAATGAVLLALGTAVSNNTVAAAITMFAVTLVVGFTAVFSGYFTAASSAVIVFYVVGTGVEGPVSVIPAREAGLAVATGMSLLAIGWLWPSRSDGACRTSLAAAYEVLAEGVGDLGDHFDSGVPWSGAQTDDRLAAAIFDAEQAVANSAWRPDGLASPHKARMYLLQGARRLSGLIGLFDDLPPQSIVDPDGTTTRLIRGMATELRKCAAALASRSSDMPDPRSIQTDNDQFIEAARLHFARQTGRGDQSAGLGRYAEKVFVLHQMSWGVMLASVCCRAIHRAPLEAPPLIANSPLVNAMTDGPSVKKWMRRARRNLNLRSVHLQNSLRLAVGLGLARLLVGVLDLQHGFWVGFATLVVLKTSSAGTRSTALQAAVGTAIGFGISTVFITTFGVDASVYSFLLPVVIFAAFYLPGAVSFVAGQACFTIVIVVLFNLLKPSGWSVGLIRLEDVFIGSAIGLTIGMAIWPRGTSSELFRIWPGCLSAVANTRRPRSGPWWPGYRTRWVLRRLTWKRSVTEPRSTPSMPRMSSPSSCPSPIRPMRRCWPGRS